MMHSIREADALQQSRRGLFPWLPFDHRGHENIFERGKLREQKVSLENKANPLISKTRFHFLLPGIKTLAFKFDGPGFGMLETRERVKQSGFSSPGSAAKKNGFTPRDVETDAAQHFNSTLAELE